MAANPKKPYKAIYAGVVAGLGTAIAAAPDGFTLVEVLGIALAVVLAGGGTYGIKNPEA